MNNTATRNTRLQTLVECAILIALACVLAVFPKFKFLPYGGSITVCSMLPIILISYRHGLGLGLLSGFIFSLFQLITRSDAVAGLAFWPMMLMVFLDYIAAFTVVGLGGIFRKSIKKPGLSLAFGSLFALFLRYVCHVISGYIFFGSYAEWFFGEAVGVAGQSVLAKFSGSALSWIYSIAYNATYMVPEMILTFIVALIISKRALYRIPNPSEPKQAGADEA